MTHGAVDYKVVACVLALPAHADHAAYMCVHVAVSEQSFKDNYELHTDSILHCIFLHSSKICSRDFGKTNCLFDYFCFPAKIINTAVAK